MIHDWATVGMYRSTLSDGELHPGEETGKEEGEQQEGEEDMRCALLLYDLAVQCQVRHLPPPTQELIHQNGREWKCPAEHFVDFLSSRMQGILLD